MHIILFDFVLRGVPTLVDEVRRYGKDRHYHYY